LQNIETGAILWSGWIDADTNGIFTVQDTIAQQNLGRCQLELTFKRAGKAGQTDRSCESLRRISARARPFPGGSCFALCLCTTATPRSKFQTPSNSIPTLLAHSNLGAAYANRVFKAMGDTKI